MLFAESLGDARTWAAANLPVVVGGLVAVMVLAFLLINAVLRHRPKGLDPAKLIKAGNSKPPQDKELNWETPEQSYADRRSSIRREGFPVRVVLASGAFRNGVCEGYVIDRSTGGLKVAAQVAVAPGGTMQVRAADAPDNVGFVTLIVRSCRKNDDFYELGCEFEKTPPWNVLLLFG